MERIPNVPKRYALVTHATGPTAESRRKQVEAYMPGNYEVTWEGDVPAYKDASYNVPGYLIEGYDSYGWTLDAYVIPRLLSGLLGCYEIDLSHPVMKGVPV